MRTSKSTRETQLVLEITELQNVVDYLKKSSQTMDDILIRVNVLYDFIINQDCSNINISHFNEELSRYKNSHLPFETYYNLRIEELRARKQYFRYKIITAETAINVKHKEIEHMKREYIEKHMSLPETDSDIFRIIGKDGFINATKIC